MIKKLIYLVVVVVVVGGLLVGAVSVHKNAQTTINNTTNELDSLQSEVNSDEAEIKTDANLATSQFNSDKTALCSFITTHVNTKTVAIPSECTTNSD